MSYVLQTFDVSKRYKNRTVLNHVNMNVEKGDIYGFVGENGSGKTTIIRLITGLIHPNSGTFSLFGISNQSPDILEARKRLGAIVESPSIYLNFSAKENLMMQGQILGVFDQEKMKEALSLVGLIDLWNDKKKAGNFSLGMRQRLGVAMVLLGNPEFIILDEPMNGLDPAGIVEIRELILRLNRESGITFLISSHILTELSLVATKYGIISHGNLVCEITSEQLQQQCKRSTFINSNDNQRLYQLLASIFAPSQIQAVEQGILIYGDVDLNQTFELITKAQIKITAVNTREFSIEDFYLSIVKGGLYV